MSGTFWDVIRNHKMNLKYFETLTPIKLVTVSGEPLKTIGCIELVIDGVGKFPFIICPQLNSSVILGSDFMRKFGAVIHYGKKKLHMKQRSFPLTYEKVKTDPKVREIHAAVQVPHFMKGIGEHRAFREELGECLVGDPIRIHTVGPPIKQKAYRQPLVKRQCVEEEVQKMLDLGVIRPSQSPWASPITLVNKKIDKALRADEVVKPEVRFCIDYRKLNEVTVPDAYPVPNIQELFDLLQGAKIFTALDLRSGYWQARLHPDDIEKSAFICHKGLFEFTRLPFGLRNAVSQYSRLMDKVLSAHLGVRAFVYIDDIVIFSKTEADHLNDVTMVLDTLAEAGLTVKLTKCEFGKKKIELLGYTVSAKGISPQEDKVEAIRDMKPPTDVKGVQRFLGMTGYYRQTIHNYANLAEPLTKLTRKGQTYSWGTEQQKAFDALKKTLTSDNIMAFPDSHLPYKLYTDASGYALGSILTQEKDGIERPIHYVSKKLTTGQQKWSPIEREAFAIVYSLKKLRPYLQGAVFTVVTDHAPLKSLFQCEMKNSRIQRWAMQIAEFGCDIEYRKDSTL
jgi:hypothetical protein